MIAIHADQSFAHFRQNGFARVLGKQGKGFLILLERRLKLAVIEQVQGIIHQHRGFRRLFIHGHLKQLQVALHLVAFYFHFWRVTEVMQAGGANP